MKDEPEDGLTFQPGRGHLGLAQGIHEDGLRSGPAQLGGLRLPGVDALALHIQPAETGENPAESGKSGYRQPAVYAGEGGTPGSGSEGVAREE